MTGIGFQLAIPAPELVSLFSKTDICITLLVYEFIHRPRQQH